MGLICIQIFGYSDVRAKDHAVDLGLAMQLTNILRDIRRTWTAIVSTCPSMR